MRKALLLFLLLILILLEIYLCTVFLPAQWQHAIKMRMPRILPESLDWTPITHPLLDQEIEQVLHEHIWLRITLYAVLAMLLAANTRLIWWAWRFLRRQGQLPTPQMRSRNG